MHNAHVSCAKLRFLSHTPLNRLFDSGQSVQIQSYIELVLVSFGIIYFWISQKFRIKSNGNKFENQSPNTFLIKKLLKVNSNRTMDTFTSLQSLSQIVTIHSFSQQFCWQARELSRMCENVRQFSRMCENVRELSRMCENSLVCARMYDNSLVCARMYENSLVCARMYENSLVCARMYENSLVCARMYENSLVCARMSL